jgi:lytic murein transglycosylase
MGFVMFCFFRKIREGTGREQKIIQILWPKAKAPSSFNLGGHLCPKGDGPVLCIGIGYVFWVSFFRHQSLVLLPQLWRDRAHRRAWVSHRYVRGGVFLVITAFFPVFLVCAAASAQPAPDEDFKAWVAELRPAALASGVSEAGFDRIFAAIAPNCEQTGVSCPAPAAEPDQPAEPDEPADARRPSFTERTGLPPSCNKVSQREFLEPAAYFPEESLRRLVRKGQAMLEDVRSNWPEIYGHIWRIEQTYGVPVPILMGLWARETAFGEAPLNHNAVVALASLAYAGGETRRPYMRRQLIGALKIVDSGAVSMENFRSSWAGATGFTQIMPDEYLAYGVDGDGDGRIDIWKSPPDALATTANVLRERGWKPQGGWGRPVQLPETADCTLEGRANKRPMSRWADQHGIRAADRGTEAAGPILTGEESGFLLMPAGTLGPAFLAEENFSALHAYNPSDLYALFIGYVGDRLGCDTETEACTFHKPWPQAGDSAFPFSVENVCRLQLSLKAQGALHGEADGLFGPQTRSAIGRWQKAQGLRPTCYPSRELFEQLTGAAKEEALHSEGKAATR